MPANLKREDLPEACDVVVLADLHMAAGRDPLTGRLHRCETFCDDAALATLLDDLRERSIRESRGVRLLGLGDLLDFCRVELDTTNGRGRMDTSAAAALTKLERIASGHPRVIAALGRLVSSGAELWVMPGNRDLELMLPPVRERFAALIAAASGDPEAAARIRFHRWIVHIPGVLYAEHGQQHHDINRIVGLMSLGADGRVDPAAVPLGTELGECLLATIEALDPEAAEFAPPLPALRAALGRGGARRVPVALAPGKRLLVRAASSGATMRRSRRVQERARLERAIDSHVEELGLDTDLLLAIDDASARAPATLPLRLARQAALRRAGRSAGTDGYMPAAADSVHRILARAGRPVPFYVFGHTHEAADVPLEPGPDVPRYLNPGGWSAPRSAGSACAGRGFVEISLDGGGSAPRARVWRWDPVRRAREPLPLPTVTRSRERSPGPQARERSPGRQAGGGASAAPLEEALNGARDDPRIGGKGRAHAHERDACEH